MGFFGVEAEANDNGAAIGTNANQSRSKSEDTSSHTTDMI